MKIRNAPRTDVPFNTIKYGGVFACGAQIFLKVDQLNKAILLSSGKFAEFEPSAKVIPKYEAILLLDGDPHL